MRRGLGLGRHLFLPETGLVPPPSSPPSTVERPKGMWRSPQSSAPLPCSSARKALPPGRVIHAFHPGPVGLGLALHAMALLQVHQAKALKQLHEGDADPGVLQELHTATDLALRATKVTARALGQTMSTLVVQQRHLWLTLADMRESDKHRFLDSPISQAGLFGEAVEDFAQQFSAAQKQTEAFRHILPRRSAAVSTPPPAAAPPSARRRGRPPALQGPGGELASAAPGGGRPSHCSALSRSCLAHLCGPHAELQDLRPALCLLRRTAEGKSCLQTKTRPLDSGGYSLGLPGPALTVPPWCESTLYERRCFLLGFGARRLNSRHL